MQECPNVCTIWVLLSFSYFHSLIMSSLSKIPIISSDDIHVPKTPADCHTVNDVKTWIKTQAFALGFADCGFVSVHHSLFKEQIKKLREWLDEGLEGGLKFLHDNHHLRESPALLVEGARTIISVRMDYLTVPPTNAKKSGSKLRQIDDDARPNNAIIARYARGRDYHKTMRGQLKKLAQTIEKALPFWAHLGVNAEHDFVFRPFADSAPIFERAIAEQSGLGWTGKHTLLINKNAGSFFVLGELFVSLILPDDMPTTAHCGSCSACMDVCPTRAIIAPHKVDAGACISYLTIEHEGAIDKKYRKAMGNRIFGCDDCQLICPWNRFASLATMPDFLPRHGLDAVTLAEIWQWDENEFLKKTEGSPLRRAGFIKLLQNTAIALGNSPHDHKTIDLLKTRVGIDTVLDEHIGWAVDEQLKKRML